MNNKHVAFYIPVTEEVKTGDITLYMHGSKVEDLCTQLTHEMID